MSLFRTLLVAAIAFTSSIAAADDIPEEPFQNHSWHLVPSLLVGVEHFHYTEGDQQPTIVLDQHTAELPTARLGLEVTSPLSRFYVRASFDLKGGSMTYDGATQTGVPLTGPTTGYMTDVEVIVGGRGRIGRHLWLGGYLGIGHHTWRRDLRPIGPPGYLEEYAWSYLPVGAVLDIAVSRRLTVSIDGSIQLGSQTGTNVHISDFPISATMKADASDLALNVDTGARLRISGNYALTREVRLIAVAGIERFDIGDGPGTPLTFSGQPVTDTNGNALAQAEPASHTTRYTFEVGASYAF